MSKKIKVSTVKQMADVEVLFINSNLISKAIRASIAAQNILQQLGNAIQPLEEPKLDEEGNEVTDENGNVVMVPMIDKNNHVMHKYSWASLNDFSVEDFHKNILPFIQELVEAFEAE
jgi:hypothetical protein